jgi:hypothetical protein
MRLDWGGRASSVLAEVERAEEFFAERVFEEATVALGAKIEAKAFVNLGVELFRTGALVALKQLRHGLHVILVQIIVRDLVRIEARIRCNFYNVAGIAGNGQILSAQITREVDHQRLILQWKTG